MQRKLTILVIFSAVVLSVNASFLTELASAKGLDFGGGFHLKLSDTKEAVPALQRINLDLSYGNVGVNLRKTKELNDVALDFYVNDKSSVVEGRGRGNKGQGGRLGMVIAFKTALIVAFIFFIMKLLIIKAIILAKVSLIISLVLLVMKLKNKKNPELLEIEQHGPYAYSHPGMYSERHPGYGPYSSSGADGGPEAAPSDHAYDVIYSSAVGVPENPALYANIAAANRSGNERKYDTAERKRRKVQPSTLLTIKKVLST